MVLDRSLVHSFQGTLTISAFCIAFLVIPSVSFDDAPTLDPKIATRSPHETANSDSCVGQCAFVFVDEMTAQMGDGRSTANLLNLNYNDFLAAFSNASFFEKFCNLYHTFNYCYTKCPQGYMQDYYKEVLRLWTTSVSTTTKLLWKSSAVFLVWTEMSASNV